MATAFAVYGLQAFGSNATLPVLIQNVPDQSVAAAGQATTVTLSQFISNPEVPGTAVRISVRLGTQGSGNIDVALTDLTTPKTVKNFLDYINAGAYASNIIHRSVHDFIIQGGGFFFPNNSSLIPVPTFAPVQNEFKLSNTRGTIAMAKIGSDPNSATSQWFINLADNSANLDNQNGGFTVFGNVIGNTMTVADAIAAVPVVDATSALGAVFSNLPLTSPTLSRVNCVETSIAIIPGLTFTASSANGQLVTTSISGGTLRLIPSATKSGSTSITVTASALDGGVLTTTFGVTITPPPSAPGITLNPVAATGVLGKGITFVVGASGVPTPTFQWQSAPAGSSSFTNLANSSTISGVTSATLAVSNITLAMAGTQFRCVATNSVAPAAISKAASLTVIQPPVFASAAATKTVVAGQAAGFSVSASGTAPITFQWQRAPSGTSTFANLANGPTFSGVTTVALTVNGTTVAMSGDQFRCVATNAAGTASSTLTSLTVTRSPATVALSNLTQVFTGAVRAATVTTNPAGLATAVTYDGSATVPTNAGSYTVVATITEANHTGTATGTLVIGRAAATVALSNLTQAFTGAGRPATVTTNPAGLTNAVTYNGSTTVPTNAGSYAVVATITDANRTGTATGTLIVSKAAATAVLANLTQTFTGTASPVTVTTNPVGLTTTVSYNSSATVPTKVGSYAVVATITDVNRSGTVTGMLVISKAAATVALTNLAQTFTGAARPATVTTTPAGLTTAVTYNGSATVPTNAGSYTVVATITDANRTGSVSDTLVISKAAATVALTNLTQTFTGAARPVTVTTTPAGLANAVTYNGSATAPTNVGSYAVVATITDANRAGTASDTLVIGKATATVVLTNLTQTFTGTAHPVTVTTTPAGLTTTITYNNSATVPVNAGNYAVAVTAVDANHAGFVTGILNIVKAAQKITFGSLVVVKAGGAPLTLNATADSGLPVTYTSSALTVAAVSGSVVTIVGAGATTITAMQTGDLNHLPAPPVSQTLTVLPLPMISTPPAGKTVTAGQAASFAITANGTAPLTFQWQRAPAGTSVFANLTNGGNFSGATTATLTVAATTVTMSGDQFRSLVTNAGGTAISGIAILTVNPVTVKKSAVMAASNLATSSSQQSVAAKVVTVQPAITKPASATISSLRLNQPMGDLTAGTNIMFVHDSATNFSSVTWNGSLFVAVGSSAEGTAIAVIETSPDGSNWTRQTSVVGLAALNATVWNGRLFVAVGENGAILTSPNGTDWTPRRSGTGINLAAVTWDGMQFISLGLPTSATSGNLAGIFLTSPDGEIWSISDISPAEAAATTGP